MRRVGGVLAVWLLVSLPVGLAARTWYIKSDGTGDAPTIQAGVDSAAVGDTVLVGPGTYSDTTHVKIFSSPVPVNVHLYKNIVLAGEFPPPSATINGIYSATAIFVHDVDSTTTVQSLRIRRADPTIYCILDTRSEPFKLPSQHEDAGIICRDASPRIEQNELVDLGYGVQIEGASPVVRNNSFLRTFAGVSVISSTTAEISNNHFDTFYVAVGGSGCAPRILNNEMRGSGYSCEGVNMYDAAPYISGNIIRDLEYEGVTLWTSQATIENNWIEASAGTGIYLFQCNSSIVRYNRLVGNVIAITIDTSYGVTVQNNTLDGIGTEGLTIVSYSDPAVSRNIISRIRFAIRCDPTTSPTFECNNVYDAYRRYTSCPDQTGLNGNFALDPQYCGIDDSGNYFLQSDSPCAPGNHPDGYDCGLIGALPVNCGTVDVQTETWGTIKSLYKGDN